MNLISYYISKRDTARFYGNPVVIICAICGVFYLRSSAGNYVFKSNYFSGLFLYQLCCLHTAAGLHGYIINAFGKQRGING